MSPDIKTKALLEGPKKSKNFSMGGCHLWEMTKLMFLIDATATNPSYSDKLEHLLSQLQICEIMI